MRPFELDLPRAGLDNLPDEVTKNIFSRVETKKPMNHIDSADWKKRTVAMLLGKLQSTPTIAQVSSQIRSLLIPLHYGIIYIPPEGVPVAAEEAEMTSICFTVLKAQLDGYFKSLGVYSQVIVQLSTSSQCLSANSGGFAAFVDHFVLGDESGNKTLIFRLKMVEARSCFRYLDLPPELRNRIYDLCVPKQKSMRASRRTFFAANGALVETRYNDIPRKQLKNWGEWLEDLAEQIHQQLSRAYPLSQVCTQLRSEYLAIFVNTFRVLIMIKHVEPPRGECAHDYVWNSRREALYNSQVPLFRKFKFVWIPDCHYRHSFPNSLDIDVDLAQSIASVAHGAPWLNARLAGCPPGNVVAQIVSESIIPLRAHLLPLLWKAELKSATVGDLTVALKDLCQAWKPGLVGMKLTRR